jgi:uncharacterized protein (DUF2252 family)
MTHSKVAQRAHTGTIPRQDRPSRPAASPESRREYLTADEREARGRSIRSQVPRSSHGTWQPAADRPDPIALLEEQAATRVPELVPVRYGRMLASPFAFYRGAALIMASDLAQTPRSGVSVQVCGDAHLSNFGMFGTPERRMIFDINDFDETAPGPWEWDVKRLAGSFEVLGRDRGFSPADRREIVLTAAREYRQRIRSAAAMGTLDAWYDQLDVATGLDRIRKEARKRQQREAERTVRQAYTRDSTRVLARKTEEEGGEPRILADPPLIVPIEDLAEPGSESAQIEAFIEDLLAVYRQTLGGEHHPVEEYRYVHAARKVVGVGSVGTRCFIVLLQGRDQDDPLFLQVKEAQESVLERFAGASGFDSHGERVVAGQRLMQGASDIFLGWLSVSFQGGQRRDFYIRQYQDWKGSVDIDHPTVAGALLYAQVCGATLARAHARWGDRIAIASYLGNASTFDEAIADFCVGYADQNERDFNALGAAVKSGRLLAHTGL